MSNEPKTLTLPADLKLSDEQAYSLAEKYHARPYSINRFFRDHLLTDLVEILKPVDKWAKEKEAFKQGKKIQFFHPSDEVYYNVAGVPDWSNDAAIFRIAPEEPWTPKVGDWVSTNETWNCGATPKTYQVSVIEPSAFSANLYYSRGVQGTRFTADVLRRATPEEIATVKAKLKADKLAEEERNHAARVKQIEEECA